MTSDIKKKSSNNVFYAMTGTGIAEFITLPVCAIKTNFQIGSSTIPETVKLIYQKGGIRAFYTASIPAIASQMFSTTSKYTIYRYLEDKKYPNSNKVFNGLAAGIISSLFTHPWDFFRVHLQSHKPVIPVLKKEGISVLYRGYSKSFLKVSVSSSLFFPVFDFVNEKSHNALFASFCASVIGTTFLQPLDYLKIRHIYGTSLYSSWNPLTYYRGFSLNLLRIVPHFMITMTIIDFMKKKFDK
jgi:hypothetical protein